ncbi:MAG: rhomboid family intramembrane serine protease [Myxococcota bacterium]
MRTPERGYHTPIRTTDSRARAEQWVLVLASQGVSGVVDRGGEGWTLVVDSADAETATELLVAHELESVSTPRRGTVVEYGSTWSGLIMSVLLAGFYLITGPRDPDVVWFQEGASTAHRVLDGEIWRTVTALTLHSGPGHLLGNVVACAVFATAVCRILGPGRGSWLILLAGAFGNGINALVRVSGHSAVGASTAVFGAVGLLAGAGLVRRRRLGLQGLRAWAPFAAGLALLAMLGTGQGTDLGAHLFGFASGVVLGLATGVLPEPRKSWVSQGLLSLLALAGIVGCWSIALYR